MKASLAKAQAETKKQWAKAVVMNDVGARFQCYTSFGIHVAAQHSSKNQKAFDEFNDTKKSNKAKVIEKEAVRKMSQ
eukprot:scaffold907_cov144-Skeletonema_menzelii.AAC.11